jgi:hypothetical protein
MEQKFERIGLIILLIYIPLKVTRAVTQAANMDTYSFSDFRDAVIFLIFPLFFILVTVASIFK